MDLYINTFEQFPPRCQANISAVLFYPFVKALISAQGCFLQKNVRCPLTLSECDLLV